MPRWYVPALLVGIVTVCAVCLGLRWRVIAQYAPATTQPLSSAPPLLSATGQPGPLTLSTPADEAPPSPTDAAVAVPWGQTAAVAADAPAGPSQPAVGAEGSAAVPLAALAAPPHAAAQQYPAKPPLQHVNINTASALQLQALPGIGTVMAQRIVDYRREHGPFRTAAQLQDVKGIGPKKYAKLAPWADV